MDQKFYCTNERNAQIVIALLKAHGIHRVIASPGSTNMTFVASIQNDKWFEIYSSVDERSAAYMACGMASETGEPVVISCTGATASRNYMPGLTEAYYRKLPVLAITSTRGNHKIGHLIDQQIDRRKRPDDIAVESVTIPMVKDKEDEHFCEVEANKAILALTLNGGGPAHINLYTNYSRDFSIKEIPPVKAIFRHTIYDEMPSLPTEGRIAIFVGAHPQFTPKLTTSIEQFCATHDSVVFIERTSGYNGEYSILFNPVFSKRGMELRKVNLCIIIGEVNTGLFRINAEHTWRVSLDGKIRDPWNNLSRVFMMPEEYFFDHYSIKDGKHQEYLNECKTELQRVQSLCPELPFGNIWIAQNSCRLIPNKSVLYFGILNSLRSWSYVSIPQGVETQSNVGGFGIDGGVSTMIGASLASPNKLHFGIFGDLAFFYDMNVVANRHVRNNVRIMLINNGEGTEFRTYGHLCSFLGEDADEFIAAAGHYGNKSPELIKHYATDLGYEYLTASNKEEYIKVGKRFFTQEITDRPMIMEVFTEQKDESDALKILQTFIKKEDPKDLKDIAKTTIKKIVGENAIKTVKNLLGK